MNYRRIYSKICRLACKWKWDDLPSISHYKYSALGTTHKESQRTPPSSMLKLYSFFLTSGILESLNFANFMTDCFCKEKNTSYSCPTFLIAPPLETHWLLGIRIMFWAKVLGVTTLREGTLTPRACGDVPKGQWLNSGGGGASAQSLLT